MASGIPGFKLMGGKPSSSILQLTGEMSSRGMVSGKFGTQCQRQQDELLCPRYPMHTFICTFTFFCDLMALMHQTA
eukprot:1160682-Pelagomonas_calceolata.AAC.4